jgi:hypothetical protein
VSFTYINDIDAEDDNKSGFPEEAVIYRDFRGNRNTEVSINNLEDIL